MRSPPRRPSTSRPRAVGDRLLTEIPGFPPNPRRGTGGRGRPPGRPANRYVAWRRASREKTRGLYRYLNRFGWLCVPPALAFYASSCSIPSLSSLYYVTHKWKGMTNTFVGLGNFARMVHDKVFQEALGHNFIFMVIQVPLMIFLALILAVILNQGIKRFRGTFRVLFFLPASPPSWRTRCSSGSSSRRTACSTTCPNAHSSRSPSAGSANRSGPR